MLIIKFILSITLILLGIMMVIKGLNLNSKTDLFIDINDDSSEEDLESLATALETTVENIVEDAKSIKEHYIEDANIKLEGLEEIDSSIPTIINEVIEIDNSVNPEVEYASCEYRIIDTSLSYRIIGDNDKVSMSHIIRGAFTTSDNAGKDYDTMNVHLVIINKETNEEVVNVVQSYHNVVSPNSIYHFGFDEVTDYNEDEYTFRCSITGYLNI